MKKLVDYRFTDEYKRVLPKSARRIDFVSELAAVEMNCLSPDYCKELFRVIDEQLAALKDGVIGLGIRLVGLASSKNKRDVAFVYFVVQQVRTRVARCDDDDKMEFHGGLIVYKCINEDKGGFRHHVKNLVAHRKLVQEFFLTGEAQPDIEEEKTPEKRQKLNSEWADRCDLVVTVDVDPKALDAAMIDLAFKDEDEEGATGLEAPLYAATLTVEAVDNGPRAAKDAEPERPLEEAVVRIERDRLAQEITRELRRRELPTDIDTVNSVLLSEAGRSELDRSTRAVLG